MEKKYILTDEKLVSSKRTVYRIQAIRDIFDENGRLLVCAGEKGGFVESEENLSQFGSCWIYDNSIAYDKSKVCENAQLRGSSQMHQNAELGGDALAYKGSELSGNAKVYKKAIIEGSIIFGKAKVHGFAKIKQSTVYGNADIHGKATVWCCRVFENADIYNDTYVQTRDVRSNISYLSKTNPDGNGK